MDAKYRLLRSSIISDQRRYRSIRYDHDSTDKECRRIRHGDFKKIRISEATHDNRGQSVYETAFKNRRYADKKKSKDVDEGATAKKNRKNRWRLDEFVLHDRSSGKIITDKKSRSNIRNTNNADKRDRRQLHEGSTHSRSRYHLISDKTIQFRPSSDHPVLHQKAPKLRKSHLPRSQLQALEVIDLARNGLRVHQISEHLQLPCPTGRGILITLSWN